MTESLADSIPDIHEILPIWLGKTGTKLARFARVARVSRPWLHRWLRQPRGDVRLHTARKIIRAMESISEGLGTPLTEMDLSYPTAPVSTPEPAEATQEPAAPPPVDVPLPPAPPEPDVEPEEVEPDEPTSHLPPPTSEPQPESDIPY